MWFLAKKWIVSAKSWHTAMFREVITVALAGSWFELYNCPQLFRVHKQLLCVFIYLCQSCKYLSLAAYVWVAFYCDLFHKKVVEWAIAATILLISQDVACHDKESWLMSCRFAASRFCVMPRAFWYNHSQQLFSLGLNAVYILFITQIMDTSSTAINELVQSKLTASHKWKIVFDPILIFLAMEMHPWQL